MCSSDLGSGWSNKGEFEFSFRASMSADDAAMALDSRDTFLAATNALDPHLKKFGLLMHVGEPGGKRSKTGTMHCPAREDGLDNGDTSDLVLHCGGVVSFTIPFNYLGSILHRDHSDHHDVDARIKKRPSARCVAASSARRT